MKWTAVLALLLLLIVAGCSRGQTPVPPPPEPAPVPQSGISLEISPAGGAPGDQVTLKLKVADPAQIKATMADGSFVAHLCFNGCGRAGRWTGISFARVPGPQGSFAAVYTVPRTLPIGPTDGPVPTPKGAYAITLSCILDQSKGCIEHPDATVQFTVDQPESALSWGNLNLAGAQPVPRLGSFGQQSSFGGTTVQCKTGSLTPGDPGGPPELIVTDSRSSSRIIPLSKAPVRGRHGYVGCQAVAADPKLPGSLYFAEADSPPEVNSRPLFTRDGGLTWAEIPVPDGATGFAGFQVDEGGVTAWFSQEQIRGSRTADGGATWQTVEPVCPPGALCAWQVRSQINPPYREGLLLSFDGGKNWQWATDEESQMSALRFYQQGTTLTAAGAYLGDIRTEQAPLLRSADGGRTWTWVEVPPPPGGWDQPTVGIPDVRVNPDGSLTAGWDVVKKWYLLDAGAEQWRTVTAPQ